MSRLCQSPLQELLQALPKLACGKVSSIHLAALKAPIPPAEDPPNTIVASCAALPSTSVKVSLSSTRQAERNVQDVDK